ncbi:MAG: hypothetical protein AAF250_13290 [Pseudomonadota bacterium]
MKMGINRLDWFLVLPMVASATMIAEIDPPRASAVSITQWEQAAILVPITLVVSLLVAIGAAVDRRCSEEYLFQLLANSALVAVASTSIVHLFWVIGIKVFDLPDMSAENMVGVTMFALTLSYYWFRFKGISQ